MIEQTPLAPDIGDCPTFAVPHSNVSAYKVNFSQWNHNNSSLLVEGGVGTATGSPLQDLPLLPWLVLPQADGGQSRLHRSEAWSTHVSPPRPSGATTRFTIPSTALVAAAAEDPHRQLL